MQLLCIIGGLVVFDVLALRFGVDSRDREPGPGWIRPFDREVRPKGRISGRRVTARDMVPADRGVLRVMPVQR